MPPNNPSDSSNPPPPAPPPPPQSSYIRELARLDLDEHVVTIVHRSFIGLVYIYLAALGAVAALIALIVLAFPDLFSELSTNSNMLLLAGGVFAIALIFLILFVATYIYRQSVLLVTDKNLIQILQKGLFVRKVSRLSMSNVEDVSAEQNGFLPTIFNYGVLMVQTAGETENFIFPYCPNPNVFADRILDARQAYANRHDDNKDPS
jgi:membrane protein YdbS with pleckstrin-like domain